MTQWALLKEAIFFFKLLNKHSLQYYYDNNLFPFLATIQYVFTRHTVLDCRLKTTGLTHDINGMSARMNVFTVFKGFRKEGYRDNRRFIDLKCLSTGSIKVDQQK